MTYKYDTHVHTAEASACASASGAEQARRYKELGYDGIIITDHFFNGNTSVRKYDNWCDRISKFCKGYENAKAVGDEIGLTVMFGFEYSYFGADLLTYGLDKDWLMGQDNLSDINVFEFIDRVHKSGGICVHAHPFREAAYLNEIKLLPTYVDGVEVYNCGNAKQEYNDRAKWFAEQYDLSQTAGSDNHHLWSDKISGVTSETKIENIEDYIKAVKERTFSGIIIPE